MGGEAPRSTAQSFNREARVERAAAVARWLGTVVLIGIGPFVPNIGLAWVFGFAAYMFGYDRALALAAMRGLSSDRVNLLGLALDALSVGLALFIFSPEATWDATVIVPAFLLTTAFRVGAKATLWSLVGLSIADIAISLYRGQFGFPFAPEGIALR